MVVDSSHRPVAASVLVGKALARSQVIGTPLARAAFECVDAIWLHDERIAEIVGRGTALSGTRLNVALLAPRAAAI
jgi:hypothetical protein